MQLRLWRPPLAVWMLLVQSALARVTFTNTDFTLVEGTPCTIEWTGATGPVRIDLYSGTDGANLANVQTLATSLTGTSFTWTPTSLPTDILYAYKISDGSGENYSPLVSMAASAGSNTASATASQPSPTTSSPATPTPVTTDTLPPGGGSFPPGSGGPLEIGPDGVSGSTSGSGGLSTGAKAGIGVAAAVIALLLLAAVAYIFYRRGKAAGRGENGGPGDEKGDGVAELGSTAADTKAPAELDVGGSEKLPAELDTGSPLSAASTTVAAPGGPNTSHPFDAAGIQVASHPQSNVVELGWEPQGYGSR